MHSSSSSFSLSSFVQYAFFAVIAYVLAGAPLSHFISDASSSGANQRDGNINQGKLENLVFPEKDLNCGEHAYKGVYILKREPLVVYIEGFLSTQEARHVVNIRFVTCFAPPPFPPSVIKTY
jgi:prolyl 4-hydroxylase